MLTAALLGTTLVLLRLESATGRRLWRWALLPLFVAWANLHSGFVLGLVLIATYWLGEWLSPRFGGVASSRGHPGRGHSGLLILVAAATLLNPHHIEALLYPVRLMTRPEVRETITELRSIFHPAYAGALFLKALAAAAAITLFLVVGPRRRLQWALLLPGIVFWVLALGSLRSVSELAVIAPAVIAAHGERLGSRRIVAAITSGAVLLLALAGGATAVRGSIPMGNEAPRRVGLGVDPVNCPAAATQFLKAADPPGRVFHVMAFGGYFIYELWPEQHDGHGSGLGPGGGCARYFARGGGLQERSAQ
jgi:hypothetical protein